MAVARLAAYNPKGQWQGALPQAGSKGYFAKSGAKSELNPPFGYFATSGAPPPPA